jgi:hypothetical protein
MNSTLWRPYQHIHAIRYREAHKFAEIRGGILRYAALRNK